MLYKYETHLHTCEASACGVSRGAEYISVYKKLGYDGIFVTDHFFGGNTAVSHELDWEERIEQYCSGYENARAEAARQNERDGVAADGKCIQRWDDLLCPWTFARKYSKIDLPGIQAKGKRRGRQV